MKKIAIITLTGYSNYGNKLQNYALQKQLELLGFEVDTLKSKNNPVLKSSNVYKIKKLQNKSMKEIISILNNKFGTIKNNNSRYYKKRLDNFLSFSKYYLNESDYWISENSIPSNLSKEYDFFIAGSDQIWNFNFVRNLSLFFLSFAPVEKRIAYAASFGVDVILNSKIEEYKIGLEDFQEISVREQKGAEIIKGLIDRNVPVVLDPTLLLIKEQWLELAKDNTGTPKYNYLLIYFLSPISKIDAKNLKIYAKNNNLKIVNLSDFKDKKTYVKGPCDFINYINNCSILCTDSFHGSVFSILLEKPFIVYKRNNSQSMYSRIETLLTMFGLKSRELENINFKDDLFDIDFDYTKKVLEEQRKLSLDYLKNALSVKENS